MISPGEHPESQYSQMGQSEVQIPKYISKSRRNKWELGFYYQRLIQDLCHTLDGPLYVKS